MLPNMGPHPKVCAWSNDQSETVEAVSIPLVDWFGRTIGSATVYVLPQNNEVLTRHMRFRSRYARASFLIMIVLLAVLVISALFHTMWLVGVTLFAMAVLIWTFPFATPQTVAILGARKSIAAARIGSVVLAASGAWFLLGRG